MILNSLLKRTIKEMKKVNEIKKILNLESDYALYNILYIFRTVFYELGKRAYEEPDELVKLLDTDMELPKFIRVIDESIKSVELYINNKIAKAYTWGSYKKYNNTNILINQFSNHNIFFPNMEYCFVRTMTTSPHYLQKNPVIWPYYALYWLVLDTKYEYDKNTIRIFLIAVRFHFFHLRYKQNIGKDKTLSETIAINIVRSIELLYNFNKKNDNSLDVKYFPTNEFLEINFFELANSESSSIEKNYFFIRDIENKNYLIYEDGLTKIQVRSSRILKKGADRKTHENKNISVYFHDGYEKYKRLMASAKKIEKQGGGGGKRHIRDIQYTVKEELLAETILINKHNLLDLTLEDQIDAENRIKRKRKAYTGDDVDNTPNLYLQKKRNKAFSANLTKKVLLLKNNYNIPPLNMFVDFLKFITKNKLSEKETLEKDFYVMIFLIDSLLGIGYEGLIKIFCPNLDNKKRFSLNNTYLEVKLDSSLFANNYNKKYYKKHKNVIIYELPTYIKYLFNKCEQYCKELSDDKQKILLEIDTAKIYFLYIKNQQKEFPHVIKLDPKHSWKIIYTLLKQDNLEDISHMFCVGRYQGNDTSRMAYGATNSRGQIHSKFLQELYLKMNLHNIIANYLNLPQKLFKPKVEHNVEQFYVGSPFVIEKEKIKNFFKFLKQSIYNENDKVKRFNLYAIYARYALSFLLGTRSYEKSICLENICFELHILIITEKADTPIKGIRTIPMCDEAEAIIRKYFTLCDEQGVPKDNIYLLYDESYNYLKLKSALELLDNSNINSEIKDFIINVPLNIGRHTITRYAMEKKFKLTYLEAFMGHYISGGEQNGIFSTMDMLSYIKSVRSLTGQIAMEFGIV